MIHLSPLFSSKKIDSARFHSGLFFAYALQAALAPQASVWCTMQTYIFATADGGFLEHHLALPFAGTDADAPPPVPPPFDWSATALGAQSSWPPSLRVTVD